MQEKRRQEFPLLPGRIRLFDNPDAGELKTIHSHYTSAVKPSCVTVASLDKDRPSIDQGQEFVLIHVKNIASVHLKSHLASD